MQKRFNTTGCCNPQKHYMVDISSKINKIITLIEHGYYFTINRARQFGKTTTISQIFNKLQTRYTIFSISFEVTDEDMFASTENFCNRFGFKMSNAHGLTLSQVDFWKTNNNICNFDQLSVLISEFCQKEEKPVLLIIDEVDKSLDNQMFLNFLGLLRNMYLDRENNSTSGKTTFQSVILAGVYDVKNLKLKLRPDEERKYNSPWNIATDFKVDMSFCPTEIETMLNSYENDHKTGMDIPLIANEIYKYTSGYPFLVSKICELIDTELDKDWSEKGIVKAVKHFVVGEDVITDDISKNLSNNDELREFIYSIAVNGVNYPYTLLDEIVKYASLFSYIKNVDGKVRIHNLIFEECFQFYFILAHMRKKNGEHTIFESNFIQNGKLNMPYVIERFQKFMHNEYRKSDEQFIEKQGRLLFLCFLKPIINGKGFYYVEPQTRENNRMDIVVTYGEQEFVIELKIWRGEKYEIEGKEQLSEYLATRNLDEGYLVTFSFLKNKVIQEEPQWIEHNGKRIYEAVI